MRLPSLAVAAVIVAAVAAGCGSGGGDPQTAAATSPAHAPAAAKPCAAGAGTRSGRVAGAPLDTLLRVPASARGHRAPLVIALHFAGGTGAEMEEATRLTAEARDEGFVVAYPTASANHFWSASGDFERLNRTLDDIERVACIDPARVYAVGISNGGFMSTVLACRDARRIAAVTLFAPGISAIGDCTPARAVSILEIHGTADAIVPYRDASGRPDADVPAFVGSWARRNGCSPTPRAENVSRTVTRFRWPGCRSGAHVEHLRLTGGKHVELLPQLRTTGLDPAGEAWRFLAAHRLPAR